MNTNLQMPLFQTRRVAYALLAIGLAVPAMIIGAYLWLRHLISDNDQPIDGRGLFYYLLFGTAIAIPLLIAAFVKAWEAYSVLPAPRGFVRKLEVAAFAAPIVVLVLVVISLVGLMIAVG